MVDLFWLYLTLSAQNAAKDPISPKGTFLTYFQRLLDKNTFPPGQQAQNFTEKTRSNATENLKISAFWLDLKWFF